MGQAESTKLPLTFKSRKYRLPNFEIGSPIQNLWKSPFFYDAVGVWRNVKLALKNKDTYFSDFFPDAFLLLVPYNTTYLLNCPVISIWMP